MRKIAIAAALAFGFLVFGAAYRFLSQPLTRDAIAEYVVFVWLLITFFVAYGLIWVATFAYRLLKKRR